MATGKNTTTPQKFLQPVKYNLFSKQNSKEYNAGWICEKIEKCVKTKSKILIQYR